MISLRRVVALAIDREQIREDIQFVKEIGLIFLIAGSGIVGGLENEAWNVVPSWLETLILYALGSGVILFVGLLLYDRYTVEESAGKGDSTGN